MSLPKIEVPAEGQQENEIVSAGDGGGGGGGGGGGFLSVENPNSDYNSHTYIYEPNRSFRNMTLDALPAEDNYRDVRNQLVRPTIEELKLGQSKKNVTGADGDLDTPGPALKGKVVKFGWIEGVFMRCLLNIWGVMLFLRLTYVIGQCGIVQGIGVILLCNVVTMITTLSMSAVSTNGQIKGGGIYYMISRSLGPEFGGAIGIMFTVANSIAVATYLIGFCDSMLDMLTQYVADWDGIVGTKTERLNDIRIIGSITLVFVLGLAVVGMEWVTRVQIVLLFLLIASQIDFLIGSFLPKEEEKKFGFVGYNAEVLEKNLLTTNFHRTAVSDVDPSFFTTFGIFFPAVTGIVAGANLSGDLKNPAVAIPKGTILAIIVSMVAYISYGVIIGSVYLSEASGIQAEYDAFIKGDDKNGTVLFYDDCEDRDCLFGSSNDQQTMVKISFTGYLVYAGCFAATLSSAIASLVGAPRVLQALARDNIYPFIGYFGVGYGANDDPFRGYILVFFISLAFTLIGVLDTVSLLLSNFFVAAYGLINFSVFHASLTKSPGWRPSFKYYNPWISLLGTFLCAAAMFLINLITALVTFALIGVFYFYISYRKPEANWGSSTQAQQFVSTLKNVQSLNETAEHVKNYRPKILVLTGIPAHRPPLIDFANLITKKLSLLICADVHDQGTSLRVMEGLKTNVNLWLKDHKIKAFYSVTQSKAFDDGVISCMNLAGLGKLSPNMVLSGYKSDWQADPVGLEQYMNVLHHGFDLHLAVGILRLKNGCDFSAVIADEEQIVEEIAVADAPVEKEAKEAAAKPDQASPAAGPSASSLSPSTADPQGKKAGHSRKKKVSTVVYHGLDGKPLSKPTIEQITQFQTKKRKGCIDVWWLYDDGGLTLLLPYILTTRSQFAECQLRVFSLANKKDELDRETRNMAALLAKFRIDYSDVTVIPDVTKKAAEETKLQFQDIVKQSQSVIPDSELLAQKEKTNRHLRLSELLREHSSQAEIVIMTLPMPRRESICAALYMSWLEIMTKDMPPFLLVRGNQTSVLTFYS